MAVITISRQYGSGGDEIATVVSKILRYRYFDKTMLTQAASEMELSEEKIVDFSEDTYQMQGFFDRLLARSKNPELVAQVKTWAVDVTGAKTRKIIDLDETHSTGLVKSTIRMAYEYDNVVILGRGGQAILKDKADVLHVRVVAPMDARVRRLHYRANMSHGGAKDKALKHDLTSADYLRRFHGIDWADPHLYDLVINTGKLSTETAAELVIQAVEILPARKKQVEKG